MHRVDSPACDGEPDLAVILVTHNSEVWVPHLCQELQDLRDSLGAAAVIVDSGSEDSSYLAPLDNVADVIRLSNRGFGASCNAGVQQTTARWLLFINCDVMISPETVTGLLFEADRLGAAVTAPALTHDGRPYQSYGVASKPPWRRSLVQCSVLPDTRHEVEVETVSGACMLVDRMWFQLVGGFDERFFLYSEETDLHRRIVKAGGRVWVIKLLAAEHRRGEGSSGVSEEWRMTERCVGQTLYYLKHFGHIDGLVVAAWCVVRIVCRNKLSRVGQLIRQYVRGVRRGHAVGLGDRRFNGSSQSAV